MSQRKRENKPAFRDVDWVLYQRLQRDVCLLYHQLANYRYIMGDLDYENIYCLPYWEHLLDVDTGQPDDEFVKNGLLMILLAMIWDELDESGVSISPYLPAVKDALAFFGPSSDDGVRLLATVEHGLSLLVHKAEPDKRLREDSDWAHETFVGGYFRQLAQRFNADRM